MTYKLKAHWEGDVVVLDEPVPSEARSTPPQVLLEINVPDPTAAEKAQSDSGFVRNVLLNPQEEVWEND